MNKSTYICHKEIRFPWAPKRREKEIGGTMCESVEVTKRITRTDQEPIIKTYQQEKASTIFAQSPKVDHIQTRRGELKYG